jgi:hypothetical protein
MNSLILNGNVLGNPKITQTKDGATKTILTVETDGKDLPLRFTVLAFGGVAEKASRLVDRDEILLSGRMVASAPTKTMAIVANSLEFLFDEAQNETTAGGK